MASNYFFSMHTKVIVSTIFNSKVMSRLKKLEDKQTNNNIVAAFQGMHGSPVKHTSSYE